MRLMTPLLLCLPLLSPLASAQEGTSLQSDWIDLVKGSKGKTMGVEVHDVQPGDTPGSRKVYIAVPKVSMGHPDEIEEVVVVGQAPEKSEPLDIKYEWVYDYDDDNYGLILQLGEGNWPIRLYMNSRSGYLHPE
ncbi:hypothetical protein [Seongchinamella sediminis]|nr:hypothetical protein [Seongchinamella sediminis]